VDATSPARGDLAATPDAPATSGVRFPPPLIYLAGFAAGVGLELAVPIDDLPGVVTVLGTALCAALWVALDGVATVSFARAKTSMVPMKPTTALVTSGPYRLTRNPMYVGMAFLYAAFALGFGVIWALAVLPVVLLAVDRLVIAKEEPYLEARFGDQYRDYKRGVRRWL
jgi:protein-S-isoprenylcysteine O-methyltransferase Ste14